MGEERKKKTSRFTMQGEGLTLLAFDNLITSKFLLLLAV